MNEIPADYYKLN